MDAGLSIAATGLGAAMTEIDTVSENIANATTTGYVAESAQLAPLPGGANGVGGGVEVTTIAQATNALLSANNLQAQGSLSSLSSLQQVLTGIEDVFPLGQSASSTSSSTSTNTSLSGQLSDFWSSWDGVASDPTSLAARTSVVDLAQGLVTTMGEAATQLDQLASNTSSQVQSDLTQVNSLLAQAAGLNGAIVQSAGSGGGTADLSDQLNGVVSQLSSLAGVNVQGQANGTENITIGGITLVQGTTAVHLASTSTTDTSTTPPSTVVGIAAYQSASDASSGTNGIAVPVSSGSLAGLLTGVNQSIPGYQNQLNTVASDLAATVNTQLAQGYDAAGDAGSSSPLFEQNGSPISSTNPATAGGLSLNSAVVTDPMLLAASGAEVTATGSAIAEGAGTSAATEPVGANDGSNAQAMAELGSSSNVAALSSGALSTGLVTSSFASADGDYQNLVAGIGSDVQNINTQVTSQTSVANQASAALAAVSGVDTDTQLTELMQFQSSYQASAKVVSVVDATIQSLLAAV